MEKTIIELLTELREKLKKSKETSNEDEILKFKSEILELVRSALAIDPLQTLDTPPSSKKNSILGIIVKDANKKIVNDLIDEVLKYREIDINAIASVSGDDKMSLTPLGLAINFDRTEVIEHLLTNYSDRIDYRGLIARDNSRLSAYGMAINSDKTDLLRKILSLDNSNQVKEVARTDPDGSTFTAIGVAIIEKKADLIKILCDQDPSIMQDVVCKKDEISYRALEFAIDQVAIGQGINIELIKTLLENGADFESLEPQQLAELTEVRDEINKIKITKKLFEGDSSITADQINRNYLLYLFKQSSIPKHFFESQEGSTSSLYTEIFSQGITSEDEVESYLDDFVAILLHNYDPDLYPSMKPYKQLTELDSEVLEKYNQQEKSIIKRNLESYASNTHLIPQNFLTLDRIEEKFIILAKSQIADEFFKETKDWILSEDQQKALNYFQEQYAKIKGPVQKILASQHQELSDLKIELAKMQKDLLKIQEVVGEIIKSKEQVAKKDENKDGDHDVPESPTPPSSPKRKKSPESVDAYGSKKLAKIEDYQKK